MLSFKRLQKSDALKVDNAYNALLHTVFKGSEILFIQRHSDMCKNLKKGFAFQNCKIFSHIREFLR